MSGPAVPPPFDAFISYRHVAPDDRWVRQVLVPALTAGGVRVYVDYLHFGLGAPVVTEIAKAVESSRFTVAVVTSAYLDSGFTDLESILAEHLGVEGRDQRLILLMRGTAQLRLGLRARVWLDMSDDASFDVDVDRLCRQLLAHREEVGSDGS